MNNSKDDIDDFIAIKILFLENGCWFGFFEVLEGIGASWGEERVRWRVIDAKTCDVSFSST